LLKNFLSLIFSTVTEEDILWTDKRETPDELFARTEATLEKILNFPEICIAVITHNGFLKVLLQVLRQKYYFKDNGSDHFINAEMRTFVFSKDRTATISGSSQSGDENNAISEQ